MNIELKASIVTPKSIQIYGGTFPDDISFVSKQRVEFISMTTLELIYNEFDELSKIHGFELNEKHNILKRARLCHAKANTDYVLYISVFMEYYDLLAPLNGLKFLDDSHFKLIQDSHPIRNDIERLLSGELGEYILYSRWLVGLHNTCKTGHYDSNTTVHL